MNVLARFKATMAAFVAMVFAMVVGSSTAFAQALDLAATQAQVLGYVGATITFIVAVGLAVLGLVMIAKAIRWARRAG